MPSAARTKRKAYPKLRFVRYADDIVVHCTQEEVEEVLNAIREERMTECKLELNEKKTKIVFCRKARRNADYKTVQFDFLGFSFHPRPAMNKEEGSHRWTNRDIYHWIIIHGFVFLNLQNWLMTMYSNETKLQHLTAMSSNIFYLDTQQYH